MITLQRARGKQTYVIATGVVGLFCVLVHWMAWEIALLLVIAWTPLLVHWWSGFARIDVRLGLFFALLVVQSGHFAEHIAQMVEIHVLGWPWLQAHGIFGGALFDTEWFHFLFDSLIVPTQVTFLLCVCGFPRKGLLPCPISIWLWLLLPLVWWHCAEHVQIMSVYLRTGVVGSPGLLAQGGAIGGGLPIIRPDLHFLYNLVEEGLLILSFRALRRSLAYNPW